jgi:hypothetical protein
MGQTLISHGEKLRQRDLASRKLGSDPDFPPGFALARVPLPVIQPKLCFCGYIKYHARNISGSVSLGAQRQFLRGGNR